MVEYGDVGAQELRTIPPKSQPFSMTKKGRKKAARKIRQAASALGRKPVKSVESNAYTKSRSGPFKAVEATAYIQRFDF